MIRRQGCLHTTMLKMQPQMLQSFYFSTVFQAHVFTGLVIPFPTFLNKTPTSCTWISQDRQIFEKQVKVLLLTTSSRAALRPNEQVSSVRQLMKDVKRSLGSAVKVLRGNIVIRLEMILEMPTASESSISILGMQTIKCYLKMRTDRLTSLVVMQWSNLFF